MMNNNDTTRLEAQLQQLHLHHIQNHYEALAGKAAEQQLSHVDYLAQLIEGEATLRENRSIKRRIDNAHFPVLKTLDTFQWSWPKKINRPQIQNLFRLAFMATQTNVVFIGNVGLGKTQLIDCTRPRRLSERTLGTVHHGRGHYQQSGRGPVRWPA